MAKLFANLILQPTTRTSKPASGSGVLLKELRLFPPAFLGPASPRMLLGISCRALWVLGHKMFMGTSIGATIMAASFFPCPHCDCSITVGRSYKGKQRVRALVFQTSNRLTQEVSSHRPQDQPPISGMGADGLFHCSWALLSFGSGRPAQ